MHTSGSGIGTLFPVIVPVIVVGAWCLAIRRLRRLMGFSKEATMALSGMREIDHISYASAKISGIHCNRCLRIARIEGGSALRLSRLLLGGSLVIADGDIESVDRGGYLLVYPRVTVTVLGKPTSFVGKTADFVIRYLKPLVRGER